jgi:hypothetical protein
MSGFLHLLTAADQLLMKADMTMVYGSKADCQPPQFDMT